MIFFWVAPILAANHHLWRPRRLFLCGNLRRLSASRLSQLGKAFLWQEAGAGSVKTPENSGLTESWRFGSDDFPFPKERKR